MIFIDSFYVLFFIMRSKCSHISLKITIDVVHVILLSYLLPLSCRKSFATRIETIIMQFFFKFFMCLKKDFTIFFAIFFCFLFLVFLNKKYLYKYF